jgi:hypothetical protein
MSLKELVTQLQLLSLLDARMNVHKHYQGFVSGQMAFYSLLENPLVSFGFPLDSLPLSSNLKTILSKNLRSNPVLNCFKCMLELQKTSSLTLVPSSIVEDILRYHIERGPLRPIELDLMSHTLAFLSNERPLGGRQAPKRNSIFELGSLHMRESKSLDLTSQEPPTSSDLFELSVGPAGLQKVGSSVVKSLFPSLSLKTALLPFLFPFGQNAFDGSVGLCNYLKVRMQ